MQSYENINVPDEHMKILKDKYSEVFTLVKITGVKFMTLLYSALLLIAGYGIAIIF